MKMLIEPDLDPPEPALNGRRLSAIITKWLETKRPKLTKETADNYEDATNHFLKWWQRNGETWQWAITRATFDAFATDLEKGPLSYNARKDAHRRLRSALKWAFTNGVTPGFNFGELIPPARGSAPLRVIGTLEQIEAMMVEATRRPNPARDTALLAFLFGTGVRRTECARIRIEDIQILADDSGTATISAKKINGRDVQARAIAFERDTGYFLRRWMDVRAVREGPLWPAARGDALTAQGIYKVFRTVAEKAGVRARFHGPHDARRAFRTYFDRMLPGEGYGALANRQLGWSPTSPMPMIYSLQDAEQVRLTLTSNKATPISLIAGMR